MNIMITKKRSAETGLAATPVLVGIGMVAVLSLAIFGVPTGVKNFFAKFSGGQKSENLASVSSFGDFQTGGDALTADDVASTIVKDLVAVRESAKSGSKMNGVCFKNPADSKADFYNVVADIPKSKTPCDSGVSIKAVVSLPAGWMFANPVSGSAKYVLFKNDGSTAAPNDLSIIISDGKDARSIVITPKGDVSYTEKQVADAYSAKPEKKAVASGAKGVEPAPVAANHNQEDQESITRLSNIASGLASVISSLGQARASNQAMPNDVPAAPFIGVIAPTNPVYFSWFPPTTSSQAPIISYKVYRGSAPDKEYFLMAISPNITSYIDTSPAGSNSYYKISAVNRNGEGPLSNELSIVAVAGHSSSYGSSNYGSSSSGSGSTGFVGGMFSN